MGKAKRSRPRHKAKPPTGLPSAREIEKEEEEREMAVGLLARTSASNGSAVQTIIEQVRLTSHLPSCHFITELTITKLFFIFVVVVIYITEVHWGTCA